MSQPAPDTVVFAADAGTVHIEKRYRLDQARYRLQLDVVVANRGDAPVGSKLCWSIGGRQDPDKRGGGFFSGVSANVSSAICYVNGKVERKSIENLGKDPLKAATERGPSLDRAPTRSSSCSRRCPSQRDPRAIRGTCTRRRLGTDAGQVTLRFARAGGARPRPRSAIPFVVFAGPKFIDDLEAVQAPAVAAAPGAPAVAAPRSTSTRRSTSPSPSCRGRSCRC